MAVQTLTRSEASSIAGVLKKSGDPARISILDSLSAGSPMTVEQIQERTGVKTSATLQRNLGVLKSARIVGMEREGRARYWKITSLGLSLWKFMSTIQTLMSSHETQTAERVGKLTPKTRAPTAKGKTPDAPRKRVSK